MPSITRREVDVVFDGSYEGFLCVVYAYYYEGITPAAIEAEGTTGWGAYAQGTLTALAQGEEFYVVSDPERARKVRRALRDRISPEAAYYVRYAFLADAPDRFAVLLQYIIMGFKLGRAVDSHLHNDTVLRVHKLAREVSRESHLLKGFSRFAETVSGVYYCAITPVHYVLPILAEHFADRMKNQSWVIHDKKHACAVVYNGHDYTFVEISAGSPPEMVGHEEKIKDLWVIYFNSLAIEERKNAKLQRNMLPLRFRGDMTEFDNII